MLYTELKENGSTILKHTYSDTYMIRKIGTTEIYSDTYDIFDAIYEYEETDELLKVETIQDSEER